MISERFGYNMEMIGIILALGYYLSIITFCANYIIKGTIWLRSEALNAAQPDSVMTFVIIGKSLFDILLLRRLIVVNDVLWFGEWIFHVSFAFVILRHLRYFLNPVPQWIGSMQTIGIIAGYILSIALVYIVSMKLFIEKKKYVSSYNFFLLALIFVMSITGLLMKNVYHPDVVAVKEFMLGMVTFRLSSAPASVLFLFHFIMVLILIIKLPTHVLVAPLTLTNARRREEYFRLVVHEKN